MSLLNSREPSWGGTDYSHHSLASDPDWNGSDYSRCSVASNPCRTHPYLTTITNLGGILSTADHQPTDSLILPSTSSHYRTSFLTPATYVYHYEIEVARWYAHKQAKRKRPDHPLSCSICLEPMEPLAWVRPTALCTHEPRICEPCLGQLVAHDVQQGLTEVCCPDVECRHQMDRRDVRGRICEDPVCLNRYNTLVAQRELESQPNFMWCQNPQCGRGQVYQEGGASPLVICQYCQSPACFTHRVPWHNGMTCEDYDLVIQRIQASEDYIGAHTKQCPSCRRPIEKLSGCDHMTCHRPGGCGHEFCWICLADYGPIFQEGNNRHNSDCRYHPDNRESYRSRSRSRSPTVIIIGAGGYRPRSPSTMSDTTSGSESSGFERVEWPPAPMPFRPNEIWQNRTSTRSTWQPVAPSRHYLRVIHPHEGLDRRTLHGQSITSRAQQTSYAESSRSSHDIVWQPSTPPTPYLRESQPQEELDRRRSRGQTINSQAQRTSYVESSRSSYDIVCRLVIPPTPRLQDNQPPEELGKGTRDGRSINSPSYIYAGSSRPSSYVARQPASPPTSHLQHNQLPEELDDRELEVQALYTWAWRQGRTASWWPPTPPLPLLPPLPCADENRNEDKRHGRVWEDTLST